MNNLLRWRRFLGLRQIDVERATGISVERLSAAERGLLTLSEAEQSVVSAYLRDRLRVAENPVVDDVLSARASAG